MSNPEDARHLGHSPRVWAALSFASALLCCAGRLPAAQTIPRDLTQMSVEDLMNVRVTSVSRKEQAVARTAAAVYVITREDIRRSGMTNIPDLLRMAPGVNVARVNANTWAISIRGFNDRYAGKVLVLIDGRSVYSQEFSGVYWDQQSVPLEQIDRIEVTRGPGGTVWGANAVNGVINIITKHSADTQGGLLSVAAGNEDSAQALMQYGGKLGSKGTYRIFGKYFNVENSLREDRSTASDGWDGRHAGFRSDWNLSERDEVTVQGDLYATREGQTVTTLIPKQRYRMETFETAVSVEANNLLGRWKHTFSNGSESSLQTFLAHVDRFDLGQYHADTADVDFQYRFRPHRRHDIVAGIGYRSVDFEQSGSDAYSFSRPTLSSKLVNTFIQDELSIADNLSLVVGTKLEHNSITHFELEPSAQLLWTPRSGSTVWFSAARAIQQPSWLHADSRIELAALPLEDGTLAVARVLGNRQIPPEQLLNFETGYRARVNKRLSLDTTVFRSYYRKLATIEPEAPFFEFAPEPPHIVLPLRYEARGRARNYGLELFAHWQPNARLRISPGFSHLRMKPSTDGYSSDFSSPLYAGSSPKYQAQVRATFNVTPQLEWDSSAYYVSSLAVFTGSFPIIPINAYTRLDTRLGWKLGEHTDFSLVGQNLLQASRAEFANAYHVHQTRLQRSVVGKLTWRF